jgi:hypothetical protein
MRPLTAKPVSRFTELVPPPRNGWRQDFRPQALHGCLRSKIDYRDVAERIQALKS